MNILYICNTNDCRSILSEAITNKIADGRIIAKSAGFEIQQSPDFLTLYQLIHHGYNIENLKSKTIAQLEGFKPNIVVTLCEKSEKKDLSMFQGAFQFHWNTPDPSAIRCEGREIDNAFAQVISTVEKRVNMMLNLPLKTLKSSVITQEPNTQIRF